MSNDKVVDGLQEVELSQTGEKYPEEMEVDVWFLVAEAALVQAAVAARAFFVGVGDGVGAVGADVAGLVPDVVGGGGRGRGGNGRFPLSP